MTSRDFRAYLQFKKNCQPLFKTLKDQQGLDDNIDCFYLSIDMYIDRERERERGRERGERE